MKYNAAVNCFFAEWVALSVQMVFLTKIALKSYGFFANSLWTENYRKIMIACINFNTWLATYFKWIDKFFPETEGYSFIYLRIETPW